MAADTGVMAAPNSCEIRAEVLTLEQSANFADKWELELDILASTPLSGPNFARVGEQVRGFTFDPPPQLRTGSIIRARAEFLGDARGGQFQLRDLTVEG